MSQVSTGICWLIAVIEICIAIYAGLEMVTPDLIPDECDIYRYNSDRFIDSNESIQNQPQICNVKWNVLSFSIIPLILCSFVTMLGCYNEMGAGFSVIILVLTLILTPILMYIWNIGKQGFRKLQED